MGKSISVEVNQFNNVVVSVVKEKGILRGIDFVKNKYRDNTSLRGGFAAIGGNTKSSGTISRSN